MPVWTGREVEGRLRGLPTLFVRDETALTPAQWSYAPHVYLNPPAHVPWNAHLALAYAALARDKLVTLVVTLDTLRLLPDELRHRCHLVVTLDCPDFHQLKLDDELRVVGVLAVGACYVVTRNCFRHTPLHEYQADRPWEVAP